MKHKNDLLNSLNDYAELLNFFSNSDSNKKIKTEQNFSNFYVENKTWMDDPEINIIETLSSFYPAYFNNTIIDYKKLKEGLFKHECQAKELFKALFKLPYKTYVVVDTQDLQNIVQHYGNNILAHGVEEGKGGMHNILLMSVTNEVKVPRNHWGPLTENLPNISALSHGPYFLISATSDCDEQAPHYPKLTDLLYIVVPFSENRDILHHNLSEMVDHQLITPEREQVVKTKIITYAEFFRQLTEENKKIDGLSK